MHIQPPIISLEINAAKRTANKVMKTFSKTLVPARRYSESWISLTVSKEKVEKVVSPPQSPTVRNTLISADISLIESR